MNPAHFLSWFNSHLCVNEVIYPSMHLQSSPLTSSRAPSGIINMNALLNDNPPEIPPSDVSHSSLTSSSSATASSMTLPVSPPMRVLESLSTLSASRPTVLHDFHSSTYLHIVTAGPIPRKQSSSMSLTSRSHPLPEKGNDSSSAMSVSEQEGGGSTTPTNTDGGESLMSDGDNFSDVDGGSSNYTLNAVAERADSSGGLSDVDTLGSGDRPMGGGVASASGPSSSILPVHDNLLPHLLIKGCTRATLYFLSPFSSAMIVDCMDCEIILGPMAGLAVLSNCVKCKISLICRKLLVKSCVDCTFFLASLAPSLIQGDSRSLHFGS